MDYWAILWAVLLVIALGVSWFSQLLGLPGNWFIVGLTLLYTLLDVGKVGRLGIEWPVVVLIAALALLGEIVELIAGAYGVKRAGGSRRGAILALVGSLVGGVVGIFVGVPIPVVGSIVAAVLFAGLGALVGAFVGEQWKGRDVNESLTIGTAAFFGRLFGTLGKVLLGSMMVAMVVAALLL